MDFIKLLIVNFICIITVQTYTMDFEWTPLHVAAQQGDKPKVQELVSQGAALETKGGFNSETPLHVAATYWHVEVVELLLGAGANPNVVNKYNSTPLHDIAYSSGRFKKSAKLADTALAIVKAFIAAKADVNTRDKWRWTPLYLAALGHKNSLIIQALRDAGAADARPEPKSRIKTRCLSVSCCGRAAQLPPCPY